MIVISIVVVALKLSQRTAKIGSINWRLEGELKPPRPQYYFNRQGYLKSSGDVRRLAVTKTSVKSPVNVDVKDSL